MSHELSTTDGVSATVATPIGPFTVVAGAAEDAVLASGWTADVGDLLPLIHPTLRPVALTHRAELGAITDAVLHYHAGELNAIDDIAVRQHGSDFLSHAWKILREVHAGETLSYTEFAEASGRPTAVRAAAAACARNAAALFVPCHRVLRRGGELGGFRWGLDAKRWLIAHER